MEERDLIHCALTRMANGDRPDDIDSDVWPLLCTAWRNIAIRVQENPR